MYGHEGGTAFPQFGDALFTPIDLVKQQDGKEYLKVELPIAVMLDNEQCFVVLSDFTGNCRVFTSTQSRQTECSSSSGGDYYYQFNQLANGQWAIGSRLALAVDVFGKASVISDPLLSDVTNSTGLDTNLNNSTMAWADFNKDGWQDLLVAGHIYICTQTDSGVRFQDYTIQFGLPGTARCNAFADLDNDGDLDIVLIDNAGVLQLFEQNSPTALVQHTVPGFAFRDVSSLSIADINDDDLPDLFIGQLWGTYPVPGANYLLFNDQNWSFSDRSTLIYPEHDGVSNYPKATLCDPNDQATWLSGGNRNRRSRGSQWIDINEDGVLDLYVTNYFLEQDEIYIGNKGSGSYTAIHGSSVIDKNRTGSNHGTGVHWADFDNDGDADLLLPQFAHPTFSRQYDHRATTVYSNRGDLNFEDTYPNNGIQFEETFAGGTWGDVNNDGLLDFYITVFYGCRYVKLYIQQPDHSFKLEVFRYGLSKLNTGQDAVWVDYDNDGRLDLCTGNGGRLRLYRNEDANAGRAIQFDLISSTNSHALGAKIEVFTSSGKQTAWVGAGRGVRMQDPYRVHFGTGENEIIHMAKVTWPDGTIESSGPFLTSTVGTEIKPVRWQQGESPVGLFSEPHQTDPELIIQPNPVHGTDIRAYFRAYGDIELIISDLKGTVIRKEIVNRPKSLPETEKYTYKYEAPQKLASGIYLMQIFDRSNSTPSRTVKFIVE